MLTLAIFGVALSGANQLLRAAEAVLDNQELPAWTNADYSCQAALFLINLYFDVNFDSNNGKEPPTLSYANSVNCDGQDALGCYDPGDNKITVHSGQTEEATHYICLHELLHAMAFGDGTRITQRNNGWKADHEGSVNAPNADIHWNIGDGRDFAYGRHASNLNNNAELMTSEMLVTQNGVRLDDVPVYLSIGTLEACSNEFQRTVNLGRRWCIQGNPAYGCAEGDTCFAASEVHGDGTEKSNILPAYCQDRAVVPGGQTAPSNDDGGGSENTLSDAAIAGIVTGSVIGTAAIATVIYRTGCPKKEKMTITI